MSSPPPLPPQFIKVQIRQDLALDVSATASLAKPLSSLPPQAETPPAPGCSTPGDPAPQLEIKNRALLFPATPSGETSGLWTGPAKEGNITLQYRHFSHLSDRLIQSNVQQST